MRTGGLGGGGRMLGAGGGGGGRGGAGGDGEATLHAIVWSRSNAACRWVGHSFLRKVRHGVSAQSGLLHVS
jgi:hypothetical protein